MNTERDNWKNITPEDATDSELQLVHKIHGPKPAWLDDAQWRENMRACAREIRSIESDAFRAGMTRASEECYLVAIHGTDKIMNGSSDEIKRRILAIRDGTKHFNQTPDPDSSAPL